MNVQLELKKLPASYEKTAVVLIPYFEDSLKKKDPFIWKEYQEQAVSEGATGKQGTCTTLTIGQNKFIFIGLGRQELSKRHMLHDGFAQCIREHAGIERPLHIDTSALLAAFSIEELSHELAYIVHLSHYTFDEFKTKQPKKKRRKVTVLIKSPSKQDTETVLKAEMMAESVMFARSIMNTPPNIATPEYMVDLIKKEGKGLKWKVQSFDERKIIKMGMNLIEAVGQGSEHPPYFVHVSYKGAPSKKETIALVGKGVCFDTGGVQNKSGFLMNHMKIDKGGAVTALAILRALSKMGCKINMDVYIPFVVNAIDGNSYVPDSIFEAYNGKTVEIRHTDAEGRLILADALAYASERAPTEIYDFATLTGASTIALGNHYASMMGTNQEAMDALAKHGQEISDKVWQLPLDDVYAELLKSDVADMANLPFTDRQPGTITGGMFLREFVDPSIPWIHMDIAAVSQKEKTWGIYTKGASGMTIRLFVEYFAKKSQKK